VAALPRRESELPGAGEASAGPSLRREAERADAVQDSGEDNGRGDSGGVRGSCCVWTSG
jgi:hypothetical protein